LKEWYGVCGVKVRLKCRLVWPEKDRVCGCW
jgi:hypothetical protein